MYTVEDWVGRVCESGVLECGMSDEGLKGGGGGGGGWKTFPFLQSSVPFTVERLYILLK